MSQISTLTIDDFDTIYQIELAAHQVPWSRKTLESNQGENYLNFKINDGKEILGFAITQYIADEATLFNIAISPKHQQKGLAKKLLNHLFAELEKKNVMTLWLEVRKSNNKAIQLYQALCFNEITLRKNYYPVPNQPNQHEDAIVMARMMMDKMM